MLGCQVGIVVKDSHNIDYYRTLYGHYLDMLESTMSMYNVESPNFIIIHLIELQIEEKLRLPELPRSFSKLIKQVDLKFNKNILPLPLSLNTNAFGTLVQDQLRTNHLSELINKLEMNVIEPSSNKICETNQENNNTNLKMNISNDNFLKELKHEKFQILLKKKK
jgi:hypothetical protein